MKSVFVHSNGCVPNRLEGKKIKSFFEQMGWLLTDRPEEADIIIVNYCGYSGAKIEESSKSIEKMNSIRRNESEMILTGCLDRISPDLKNRYPFSRFIEFSDFPKIFGLNTLMDNLLVSDSIIDGLETTKKEIFNILTSKGCLGTCSYCAIRNARGKLTSKPIFEIEKEFLYGIDKGYRKFILWADDLGAYGTDLSTSYIELLERLTNARAKNDYQLFLHRLNPQWVVNRFSELMTILKSGKIRLLYTPIESGSSRILQLMRRPYDIKEVIERLKEIKMNFSQTILKTDIMIGFPSETDDDFEQTIKAIWEVKVDDLVVFNFSGISGTPAFEMENQIPEIIKNKRKNKLWETFPFLRYFIEVDNGKLWIIDKKDSLRVPALISAYTFVLSK